MLSPEKILLQVPVQFRSYAPVTNTKDNPPCNTLFIGNLSEHTSEDELRGIFQDQPGAWPLWTHDTSARSVCLAVTARSTGMPSLISAAGCWAVVWQQQS